MTCWFLIVTKLVMLKILLYIFASVLVFVHSYEFGYHPSAEEFDSYLRETGRTWTREILANERQHSTMQSSRNELGASFMPKYNYENKHNRHDVASHNRYDHWQHEHQPQDGNIVGSILNFTMFSEELSGNSDIPLAPEKYKINKKPTEVTTNSEQVFSSASFVKPIQNIFKPANEGVVKKPTLNINSQHQSASEIIELAETSLEESEKVPVSNNKYSLNNLYKNNSEANFPIFFTNPVTGIVYAITEVGKLQNNISKSNDTISIYITKEQYDRDMFLMRKHYENECKVPATKVKTVKFPATTSTVISASSFPSTTERPQIIRLQRPFKPSKLPSVKLPSTNLLKPPPIMVQTEVTINDQVNLPAKRKTKLKRKRKKSKKRPGRKPSAISTSTIRSPLPHIVMGIRSTTMKPASSDNWSTQLEKPSETMSGTIFSNRALVATSGYMTPVSKLPVRLTGVKDNLNLHTNHRIARRSVTNIRNMNKDGRIQHNSSTPFFSSSYKNAVANVIHVSRSKSGNLRGSHNKLTHRRRISKLTNHTVSGHSFTKKNITQVLHTENTRRSNTTKLPVNKILQPTLLSAQNITEKNVETHNSASTQRSAGSAKNKHTDINRRRNSKNKNKSSENDSDDVFDFFDFVNGGEDDDADDDDDDYDSYYNYDDHKRINQHKKSKRKEAGSSESTENTHDSTTENLKEDVTQGNSSSAEEGADFGAMEEHGDVVEYADTTEENFNSYTKSNPSKKRIRRRPPVSYEDYDDADESGGIGGFFRMIFYPVQAVMSNIFDGFTDKSEEDDDSPVKYPTYTLYNNAIKQDIIEEDDGYEPTNSFSSWFSTLFGFNRKTKKIGSTTTTTAPPKATEEAGWFDSWFNYGGKATTTEASYEDYGDDDKWFSGWFDSKPKAKRRTTTHTTTTSLPQVPILTIVDPLKNPQNWIGILAHHILNSTSSTTTHNPLIEAITRATRTTTDNPDILTKMTYDKYQIWRLKPQDEDQVKSLEEFKKGEDGIKLQWLKGPSLRGLTDVLVPPKMFTDFEGSLNFEAIAYEVLIFDVGKAISYEKSQEQYYYNGLLPQSKNKKKKQSNPSASFTMSWQKYYEYDDIIKYLEVIRMRQPQIIDLIHIGRSYEGRPLVIVKIESKEKSAATSAAFQASYEKLNNKRKTIQANSVFIESGSHGNEWIGPAATTWMISELLRIMKSNKTSVENELVKNTTWYIMPVLNPDGYVYSHEYDRFWKKSRSRHISKPSSLITSAMTWLQQKKAAQRVCYGVDLDQNWNYHWGKRGSSKSPCNEFFAGPVPFSEPETKALSEFLMDNRKHIKLYLSMQAYGQIISYPMKANWTVNSERMDDFIDVATVGIDGLRKKGSKTRYKIDFSLDLVEYRSGCSDAFAAYEVGIPFSYMLQLADNGVHGYLLPSSRIEPTAQDAFEIIKSMLDYI